MSTETAPTATAQPFGAGPATSDAATIVPPAVHAPHARRRAICATTAATANAPAVR